MDHRETAKKLVEEAIVLLKNQDNILPFRKGQRVAFFGRAQIDTIYSGNGSGAAHASVGKNILEECDKCGICAEEDLKDYYYRMISQEKITARDEFDWSNPDKTVNSGIMYEIFGRYRAPDLEYDISKKLMEQSGTYADTAVLVIGRNSGGEECDRHLDEDYYLTDSETVLIDQICNSFQDVVLILNINGLLDLSWIETYKSIKGILFAGILGEEGAAALADILIGNVNPSGKLPITIAKQYTDYPAAFDFSWNKEDPDSIITYANYGLNAKENGSVGYQKSPVTVYKEDIYAGYRYFDTFGREPLFAFGYGLSYTEFKIDVVKTVKVKNGIEVIVNIKNVGTISGKEAVQVYLAVSDEQRGRAYQELKGFEKTKRMEPQEEEQLCILIPWREFSFYDEEKAAYTINQGVYQLLVGNSSRNTKRAIDILVKQDVMLKQCRNRLGIQTCNYGKIKFLECSDQVFKYVLGMEVLYINPEDVCIENSTKIAHYDFSGTEKVKGMSIEQLAALCVGYGPGTPFSAFGDGFDPKTIYDEEGRPLTTNSHNCGYNGYVSPAMKEAGIDSVFYKDGPAGIGEMAWPSEMLMACTFNRRLWYEFGNAVGTECEKQQVDIWLAPAVNLQRHPLGGRNFEYFSEDPYLTGICACEIAKGVQENHPVLVCPKHFAINEQETYRRGSTKNDYDAVDSIIQERAARELYLKPFEMLVKEVGISCIMTSFNKINGIFAAGSKDLCTHILREEWGFVGAVVTDWGDLDVVVDGAKAVAAGNDIVMPGGPPVIAQILQGWQDGIVSRKNLESAVIHLVDMIKKI